MTGFGLGGRDPVKPGERPAEALRGIVTVAQRDVDDLFIGAEQLASGKRQPAAADVFPQRETAQDAEYALKMKA